MTKSTGVRPRRTDAERLKMREMYLAGYSRRAIGKVFGVTENSIGYQLIKFGVPQRPQGTMTPILLQMRSGKNHPKWKGGRKTHKRSGYVSVLCRENPYSDRKGYILEHRLVMERHLQSNFPDSPALDNNKRLRSDWIVHHRNGIKTDNRIENLEPMPRLEHHSWMHFRDEFARLKALLVKHNIPH